MYKQQSNKPLILGSNIASNLSPICRVVTTQSDRQRMIAPIVGLPFEHQYTSKDDGQQSQTEQLVKVNAHKSFALVIDQHSAQ